MRDQNLDQQIKIDIGRSKLDKQIKSKIKRSKNRTKDNISSYISSTLYYKWPIAQAIICSE